MLGPRPKLKPCENETAFDENTPDYYFNGWRLLVKMKHHDRPKLEGLRLPNAVNQADLAPWLAPVIDNVDFFYDGTNRNSSLDS
ncbi:hypothetical protein BASA83_003662 [Batrachochytrium salamandrivorans]|nr:hypothetical protein BASA83_003662 [Batrachochytrium salamandrivorans]